MAHLCQVRHCYPGAIAILDSNDASSKGAPLFSRVGPAPPQPERRGEGAEMLLLHGLTGKNKQAWKEGKIRGMAVLVKSGVLDLGDFNSSVLDGIHKILDSQGRWRLLPSRQRHRTQPPELCILNGIDSWLHEMAHVYDSRDKVKKKKKRLLED
uniref:Uncharacterized protein n=1 Tax=Aegilops tauschii TaxID=37682 RepID=M8BUW7_AEGTA